MRNVLLGLAFTIGFVAIGCGPDKPPNDPPPPPGDSGADKNKPALFPIPGEPDPNAKKAKSKESNKKESNKKESNEKEPTK